MSAVSRKLSLVLRHEPLAWGLTLDANGWVDVTELLAGARAHGVDLDEPTLRREVAGNDKQRFTLSPDGLRIRAAQGHSVTVDLGLAPVEPPATLFHGTAAASLEAIRAEGLKPQARQKVHLSPDEETARKVGSRHGEPVVLRVDTGRMHADGLAFWRADNGVWLTDAVPPAYLGV